MENGHELDNSTVLLSLSGARTGRTRRAPATASCSA